MSNNNREKTIEKELFVMKVDEINKNFRKYPREIVQNWIEKMDEYGYEVEFGVNMKSSDVQYEFIKSELMCGLVTKLSLEENELYATVKFFTQGPMSDDIYSGKVKLEECVIVPKGKAEVRDGLVQPNYKLYGFNLVHNSQSSFCK